MVDRDSLVNKRLFVTSNSDSQNSRRARNIILEIENFFRVSSLASLVNIPTWYHTPPLLPLLAATANDLSPSLVLSFNYNNNEQARWVTWPRGWPQDNIWQLVIQDYLSTCKQKTQYINITFTIF